MINSSYLTETSISHRKDYGQFFTPSLVAHLMAEWVMKDSPKTILDPAFGLGIFYEEVEKINQNKELFKFIGFEIDDHVLSYYNYQNSADNLTIVNEDYLEAELPRFDAIICNPPYLRFQKFLKRHDILPKIEKRVGKKLVGYSNLSSIFLIKALQELNHNGRLAFIMPFEFFNTGYGKEIKKSLLETHLLKQIVIFSNEKEIFPEAITTACLILCRNDGINSSIKITKIQSNEEIREISEISQFYHQEISSSDLPYSQKWTPIIFSIFSKQNIPHGFCKLSTYGTFKRGIATGANEFFALTQSKIKEFRINPKYICKCITKSQLIRKVTFKDTDFIALFEADQPVYCLDVKYPDTQEIFDYLRWGEQMGYDQRYLTKHRNPWYKIEHRHPSPILLGVFNRGRFKVIRNFTNAINFTCYHSFYPNLLGESMINKLFIYFLSDLGQSIIKMNKRTYGDQLDKFEPGDLNSSYCPNINQFELIHEEEVKKVLEVAQTNEKLAIQMSNQLIQRILI